MTSARAQSSEDFPSPRGGEAFAPPPLDDDDGIHIASVTRVGPPGRPVLSVVVSWWEEGSWVERSFTLDGPSPGELVPAVPGADSSVALRPGPIYGSNPDDALLLLGVRATAERLGVSERTLRRRYARAGTRLHDRIDELRRERTLELLRGGLPVSVIALRLGFASSQTFARWVRRAFGATATGLRRRLRTGRVVGP